MNHYGQLTKDFESFRLTPSVFRMSIVLLLLGILPGIGMGIFNASSTALGLTVFCVISMFYVARFMPSLQFIPSSITLSLFLLLIYSSIQMIILNAVSTKLILSFPLFIFVSTTAFLFAAAFYNTRVDGLSKALLVVFLALTFIAILNITFTITFLNYKQKPSLVPFSEPSVFAQFFGPISIMTFVMQQNLVKRILVAGTVVAIAFLIPSLTLLIYTFLIFFLSIKIRLNYLFFSLLSFMLIAYLAMTTPHFFDRLLISDSNQNLSVLVYLQGLTDVSYSLETTDYLGLGFQHLGTQPASDLSRTIEAYAGSPLNREDGGFLAAKILAELGILGVIFLIYYVKISIQACLFIREGVFSINNDQMLKPLLIATLIFAFSTELFARGSGYFTPGVFLFIFSLFYYKKYMNSSFSNFRI